MASIVAHPHVVGKGGGCGGANRAPTAEIGTARTGKGVRLLFVALRAVVLHLLQEETMLRGYAHMEERCCSIADCTICTSMFYRAQAHRQILSCILSAAPVDRTLVYG